MPSWTGTRSGWNERGGTWREHLSIQMENAEINAPDSLYWRILAEAKLEGLLDQIGSDDYTLWAEITWPGDSVDDHTWKEMYEAACAFHPQMLECSCNGVTEPCGVCQAYSRINYSIDEDY